MRILALLLLLPSLVLADIGWRQGGVAGSNRVLDVECQSDGGLYCVRDAGTKVGLIRCVGATATEIGCVSPSAQTWAGTKSLTGDLRLVGHIHASLTACAAGTKGTWQTCTTHSAPVFCNGTSNVELLGVGNLVVLPPFYVNGLLHSRDLVLATFTLPFAFTITQTSGFISAGTGVATSLNVRYSDGTNNCDCAVDCDTSQTVVTCAGNCTYAASTTLAVTVTSDACTTPPTVHGLLTPAGYY